MQDNANTDTETTLPTLIQKTGRLPLNLTILGLE